MSISDSIVHVVVLNHQFPLDDIYDSLEEALADRKYHDKHGIIDGNKMQVYKASVRGLVAFYKGYHNASDPKKYLANRLTQVYPDPFKEG